MMSTEDNPYIQEVVKYLKQNQLEVALKTPSESNEPGNIALLAKGGLDEVSTAVFGLYSPRDETSTRSGQRKSFPKRAADGLEYNVLFNPGRLDGKNKSFTVQIGKTKIDLFFKARIKAKAS